VAVGAAGAAEAGEGGGKAEAAAEEEEGAGAAVRRARGAGRGRRVRPQAQRQPVAGVLAAQPLPEAGGARGIAGGAGGQGGLVEPPGGGLRAGAGRREALHARAGLGVAAREPGGKGYGVLAVSGRSVPPPRVTWTAGKREDGAAPGVRPDQAAATAAAATRAVPTRMRESTVGCLNPEAAGRRPAGGSLRQAPG